MLVRQAPRVPAHAGRVDDLLGLEPADADHHPLRGETGEGGSICGSISRWLTTGTTYRLSSARSKLTSERSTLRSPPLPTRRGSVEVWPVRTPNDLRGAFADQGRTHYIVPDDKESEVRELWDGFFETFSMISPVFDPAGMVTTLVEGDGAETLAWLAERGLQVVAVKSSGTLILGGGSTPATQTDFVAAPKPLWFCALDRDDPVHLLGARCLNGHRVFAVNGAVRVWPSQEQLSTLRSRGASRGARRAR